MMQAGRMKLESLKAVVASESLPDTVRIVGGPDFKKDVLKEHHVGRVENLTAAKKMRRVDILKRIATLRATLPADKVRCIYGDVRYCTNDEILTISMIEDLEVAAGVHPYVGEQFQEDEVK